VSVDTYLRGKNLGAYSTVSIGAESDDPINVLVSQKMAQWASDVAIGIRKFLIWESFDVRVIPVHAHAPGITCKH
jgi:hypothetical protein